MPPVSSSDYVTGVVQHTDTERAARDLSSLLPSRCLAGFADQHARDMAQRGRLYHQDLGVVLTTCRLQAVGENVAVGYADGTAATQGWLRSPAHRGNLLAPSHTHIGVGARVDAQGRWFVSQLLAARAQDDQQGDEPLGRDLMAPLRGGA